MKRRTQTFILGGTLLLALLGAGSLFALGWVPSKRSLEATPAPGSSFYIDSALWASRTTGRGPEAAPPLSSLPGETPLLDPVETLASIGRGRMSPRPAPVASLLPSQQFSRDSSINGNSVSTAASDLVWVIETVDSASYVGKNSSLALGTDGYPHISYYNEANENLKYAHYDGAAWQIETVDTGWRAGGNGTALALDTADRPHIVYRVRLSMYESELRYAHYDDTTWQIETVDHGDSIGSSALVLDAAGRPHISYNKSSVGLVYAYYNGSTWLKQVVDGTGGTSYLQLDTAGRPHIGYAVPGPVSYVGYAYDDGNAWYAEIVAPAGKLGGVTSLVLDTAGQPYIGYLFSTTGYDNDVMYAHYDGQNWQFGTVDVGAEGPDLALDAQGHLHAVYPNRGSTVLQYACYDGTTWQIEAVANEQGSELSLALDGFSRPHISYYSGDLKYAYACTAIQTVTVTGPVQLPIGITARYEATYAPTDANPPLVRTWDNGVLSPTAAYSWTLTGTYTLGVTATNPCGQARDTLTVTVFCQSLAGLRVTGPPALRVGQVGTYLAVPQPLTASWPLTTTWDNGALGTAASYSWTLPGTPTLAVTATNVCGGAQGATFAVRVWTEWPYRLYLPLCRKGLAPLPERSRG